MKSLLLSFLLLLTLNAHAALSGNDKGNGGDLCEARFYEIRNDITTWINAGGSGSLQLPSTISLPEYNNKMLKQLSNATVECVTSKLTIDDAEKTCVNMAGLTKSRIVCNLERFMAIPESEQYALTHHEYAGLAGFETNQGVVSNYDISNQISGFLKSSVVKKLAIKSPVTIANLECNNDLSLFTARNTKGSFEFSLKAHTYWKVLNLKDVQFALKDPSITDLYFKIAMNKCTWDFNDGRLSCKDDNVYVTYKNIYGVTKTMTLPSLIISSGVIGFGVDSTQMVTISMTTQDQQQTFQTLYYPAKFESMYLRWGVCNRVAR